MHWDEKYIYAKGLVRLRSEDMSSGFSGVQLDSRSSQNKVQTGASNFAQLAAMGFNTKTIGG